MNDKQQTALRNIISKFDEIKDLDPSVQILILRGECEANLEIEKQQIIDAVNYGANEEPELGLEYFNDKFKTESNGK